MQIDRNAIRRRQRTDAERARLEQDHRDQINHINRTHSVILSTAKEQAHQQGHTAGFTAGKKNFATMLLNYAAQLFAEGRDEDAAAVRQAQQILMPGNATHGEASIITADQIAGARIDLNKIGA